MKKMNYLTGIFFLSLLFVACDKKDEPTPKLTMTPSSVEVKISEEATVKVSGGTTPYTVASADTTIATATVTASDVKVAGVKEGQTTITVTDKNKVQGSFTVKVTGEE